MATSSLQEKKITFTICFENSRLTLTIPKSIKVYEVLQKAADEFKVKPEGLGFLYNGLKVPEEITVEVCESGRGKFIIYGCKIDTGLRALLLNCVGSYRAYLLFTRWSLMFTCLHI